MSKVLESNLGFDKHGTYKTSLETIKSHENGYQEKHEKEDKQKLFVYTLGMSGYDINFRNEEDMKKQREVTVKKGKRVKRKINKIPLFIFGICLDMI